MPSIICRSTAGSLRPLPAICSASKIAGYKNVRFVPRSTCGFTIHASKQAHYYQDGNAVFVFVDYNRDIYMKCGFYYYPHPKTSVVIELLYIDIHKKNV